MSTFLEANSGFFAKTSPITLIIGLIAVLGIIGALKGLSRGICRQTIRTLTVIASGVISFFLSTSVYKEIISRLDGMTMADVESAIRKTGLFAAEQNLTFLHAFDVYTLELVMTIPLALIIMPLLFVISFILISGILLIVHWILSAIFGFRKRRNNALTRLLGMALGLVQGVAVAALLLMPLVGIGNSLSKSVETINDKAPNSNAAVTINEAYNDYVKDTVENPVYEAISKCGMNALYKSIATVSLHGKESDMTALVPDITAVVIDGARLKSADFKKLTPENEEIINSILNTLESNAYITELLSNTARSVSYAYTNGTIHFSLDEPYNSIIDSAFEIFHTSDPTNIHTDLDTIKTVYFILSRDGVLYAFTDGYEVMRDVLTTRNAQGETTVNRIVTTINSNERTKPLVTLITKISVTVMSKQTGINIDSVETYDNIKESINTDILTLDKNSFETEEEYVAEVSKTLDSTLKENNINIEKEIVDDMAKHIADNYSDKGEISDEEANDIILSYYDAYLEYMETGKIPDGFEPPVTE